MKIAEAFVEAAATVCDSQSVYFGSSNINSLGLGGIWGLHRMVLHLVIDFAVLMSFRVYGEVRFVYAACLTPRWPSLPKP